MSKRKLTQQQRWRIEKIQAERTARAKKRSDSQDDLLQSGELGPEQPGLVISHYGTQLEVEALEGPLRGQSQRCHLRTHLEGLVTGDRVTWRPGEPTGVVVAVEARRSVLLRPDNYNHLKPIAANIDHIIVVIAPEPEPHFNLVDRYLIAAEASHITPIILLNKSDCIDNIPLFLQRHGFDIYQHIGYQFLAASTTTAGGLGNLKALLEGKTSVFVGQSGVGKSSLINALLPEAGTAVGALSEIGKGSHTTSTARLFHLPDHGGDIIDSPGIREFALWHIEPADLLKHFTEFKPLLGSCRFRDCSHEREPGCALHAAIQAGAISQQRFDSYRLIKQALDENAAQKYD